MGDDFGRSTLPVVPPMYTSQTYVVYTFETEKAFKPLEMYLQSQYPQDYVCLENNSVIPPTNLIYGVYDVKMSRQLNQTEINVLAEQISNWVQPEFWWELDKTFSYPTFSEFINSSIPFPVQTFINVNRRTDTYGLNSIKTIVEYKCENVGVFANKTTATLKVQLYDVTRDWMMVDIDVPIYFVVSQFRQQAVALGENSNVPSSTFRSLMISDLWDKSVNYDTIWQIRMGVTDPDIKIRIHGLQNLYYNKVS